MYGRHLRSEDIISFVAIHGVRIRIGGNERLIPTPSLQHMPKRSCRKSRISRNRGDIAQLNPHLTTLEILIHDEDPVHDEIGPGHHVSGSAIQACITVGGITSATNPALQQVVIENDLPLHIAVFNSIHPVTRAIDIRIESDAAFEEIAVASAADECVISLVADEMVLPISTIQHIFGAVADENIA